MYSLLQNSLDITAITTLLPATREPATIVNPYTNTNSIGYVDARSGSLIPQFSSSITTTISTISS